MNILKYAKALAALVGALVTFLITVGAPPEWATWLGAVSTILTGIATFGIPNVPAVSAPTKAVTSLTDVQSQINQSVQSAQTGVQQIAQTAVESINTIQQTVGGLAGGIPVVGGYAEQVIDSVKVPKL